jgi:serine/threonine protein kinase/predicted Zn-dependent protease
MGNKCPTCHSDNPDTLKFCGECGTQLPPPQNRPPVVTETLQTPVHELTTGSTFAGRYQVIEELGHGGMGKVYKVFDTKVKEKVALKLIKPEVASDKETIERFSNEIRLARGIRHKNVCGMFDIGEAEGAHFITMEYVHGEDLKSMIHMSGSLSLGMLLSVGKQVSDGLAEAHSLGVVHRDLKPQNIMIDKNGNAKIMDFGIARSVREKGITGPSVMIGTPEYMSPEQAEAKEVDHRSDIYSLGVILYEMATSHVPFTGETALSVAMKHKGEVPKSPKQLNPNIPNDLTNVILKCLEKDKAKRYQSASDIHSELEKIEKGIPTTERVVPERKTITSRQITVQFRPKRLVLPGLALVAVVIAAIVLPRLLSHKKGAAVASGKPSLAVVYFENKTGDESLDEWSTALPDLLTTDLSQSRLLRVLSGDKIYSVLKKLNLHETKRYSTDDLVRVANEGPAEYTVSGSFIKAGSQLLVSATLQKPRTEEVIKNIRVECPSFDEIQAKVDDLTRQIKAALNLTEQQIASDLDKNLGQITSPNTEALRYYVEAKRYHWRGDYDKAIPLLEKAVALDPEFIVAFEALGSAHYNLSEVALNDSYIAKALELIKRHPERISDRDRYLIEGRHYYWDLSDRFWPKAVENLTEVLDIDPEDTQANYDLGSLYNSLEQWDRALAHFNICSKNKYEFFTVYERMARAFRAKGMPDRARETFEYYLGNISDTVMGRCFLAYHYTTQGKLDLARQETEKAVILDPTAWPHHYAGGVIALLAGDLALAEREFTRLLEEKAIAALFAGYGGLSNMSLETGKLGKFSGLFIPFIERMREAGEKDNECSARCDLADFYLKAGDPGRALDQCQKASAVAVEMDYLQYLRSILSLKGRIYLEMKNIPEAAKAAEELKAVNAQGMRKDVDIRIYDHLMGRIELEKRNYSGAIERLKKAVDSLPYGPLEKNAGYIDSLALAYFRAGNLAKAQIEYERITTLTTGRLAYGDIYAKSFYMLGRIFEQKGDELKARENYQRFLDLWKDADSGLPEVPDAQKRLAGLKGS